ncbi:DsrE family protein [Haladaptatus sp. AB643]|uniref:DsrE family protein n=1 Tax=Haladaptatus sp. AB643 TaxID=2934174 RepID=UPI00209BEE15|nr:DsrE family protein [Haladaptatus sp. AB643]MCO8244312.1 DsrE family protein [Haladaptatus sp. AB643]
MKTVVHVSSPDPNDQREAVANTLNLVMDESVSAPDDDVVVLANGAGIRMFVEATSALSELVEEMKNRDVALRACRNALRGMGATDDDLLPGVEGVPSGSGELAKLQAEGYGYIKAP